VTTPTELPEDISAAHDLISQLKTRNSELEKQVAWFKQQIFGVKSERREGPIIIGNQLYLGNTYRAVDSKAPAPTVIVKEHPRKKSNKQELPGDCGESGLRFDDSIPIEEVPVPNPEVEGLDADEYEVLRVETVDRLAQKKGSFYVRRYMKKVVKLKKEERISEPAMPPAVLEGSFADVTFLAGMLVDKFVYHTPLCRTHQRLTAAGVRLSRGTLTNWAHGSIELVRPIYEAQAKSVISSETAAMDETPLKAGRQERGKMRRTYFWPVYGDKDEVIFPWAASHASAEIGKILGGFKGTLITDGNASYGRYVKKVKEVTHAECWSHTRRQFLKAEAVEPERVGKALAYIRGLYELEDQIDRRKLAEEDKLAFRVEHSKPTVEAFFDWLGKEQAGDSVLPSNLFSKAAVYALSREKQLSVFLSDPHVPLDTNHLERALRVVPMGRRNWLFCWTELGAEYVGIIQSLLVTCRLQDVDPFDYLVDVLQRVKDPAVTDYSLLTPRLWKEHFGKKQQPPPKEEDPP
jgi:transposase